MSVTPFQRVLHEARSCHWNNEHTDKPTVLCLVCATAAIEKDRAADPANARLAEASTMADRARVIAEALPGWAADSPVESLNLELQALTAALRSWSRGNAPEGRPQGIQPPSRGTP